MNEITRQLALVGALVLLNALFAGSEIALISLRDGQVARLEQQSRAGRKLARLVGNPNQFMSTIQIGITLAGFLASAAAATTLAQPLVEPLEFLGGAARPTAIIAVTVALSYVTLVAGELAPKRLAMQRAERWSLVAARPLVFLGTLARPAVWLLSVSTDLLVRLFGGDPERTGEEVTEEELRDLIGSHAQVSDHQRQIMEGAFEVADRPLRDMLVPRTSVVAFPADTPSVEALDRLLATSFSRAPVYRDTIDEVCGLVSLRDLVHADGSVEDHVVEPLLLPESLAVLDALRTMQDERTKMAVVVNEYGGIDGIVTAEDLVEELVGEIYDRQDADIIAVEHREDGAMVMRGGFPIHDLRDLDVEVPEGDYSTVAGLVLDRLGGIPEAGDRVEVEGWRLTVLEMRGKAIARIELEAVEGGGSSAGGDAEVEVDVERE